MKLILILFILIFANTASADVLFLDLNFSTKEVEAAERAARTRGEKLIVIPFIEKAARQKIEKLKSEHTKLLAKVHQVCNTSNTAACVEADRAALVKFTEIESERKTIPKLDKINLGEHLSDLKSKKANITSVVISGHDGNGSFNGSMGHLSDSEFKQAFEDNAPLGNNVRSLMLWGCHTSNLGSLHLNWKKTLPNLNVIAGFDDVAPGNDKLGSSTYLEDVLAQEKKLSETRDKKALHEAFLGLRNIKYMNASVCVGDNYITRKKVESYSKAIGDCSNLKLAEHNSVIKCYYEAKTEACKNPPANFYSGNLRDAYTYTQSKRHCSALIPDGEERLWPTESVLRIIHSKYIVENAEKIYAKDFNDFNLALKKLGAPDNLLFKNLSKLTRLELREKFDELTKFLNSIEGKFPVTHDDWALLRAAKDFKKSIDSTLISLQPRCSPFSWLEAGAEHPSRCFTPSFDKKLADHKTSQDRGVADFYFNEFWNETYKQAYEGYKENIDAAVGYAEKSYVKLDEEIKTANSVEDPTLSEHHTLLANQHAERMRDFQIETSMLYEAANSKHCELFEKSIPDFQSRETYNSRSEKQKQHINESINYMKAQCARIKNP